MKKASVLAAITFFVGMFFFMHYWTASTIKTEGILGTAEDFLRTNSRVDTLCGRIRDIHLKWWGNNLEISGKTGEAVLYLTIAGERQKADAKIDLAKSNGAWSVQHVLIRAGGNATRFTIRGSGSEEQ